MRSHFTESVLPAHPRFHVRLDDGLFRPIAFLLVTETMRQEIEQERELILGSMPSELRTRQVRLLARYDPGASARAFRQLLRMVGCHDEKPVRTHGESSDS